MVQVGCMGAWLHGCVGDVGQTLGCLAWAAWVHKILV